MCGEAEVAPLMSRAPVMLRDIVVIAELVTLACIDWIDSNMIVVYLEEAVAEPILPLQAVLVVIETNRGLLEVPKLLSEPFDTVVHHQGLILLVELWQG